MNEKIELVAKSLVASGLRYAFGVTGSGASLALITELENLGVQYYPVAHEASAALMAGAVCRGTGALSVSISIKGPGLTNMLPGIAYNYFEGNPALSISEAFGADVPVHRKHKRLNHEALLAAIVKRHVSLNEVDEGLEKLLDMARAEVPGPIHMDLCLGASTGKARVLEGNPKSASRGGADRKIFFKHLKESARPIVVVGSLASRRSWSEGLEALHIPVFTTASAKGVLDERLAHSAGVFTGDGKELTPERHLFSEADLVVGIGLRNTEVLSPKPFGKTLLMVDEVDDGLAGGFQCDTLLIDRDYDLVAEVLDVLKDKNWGLERLRFLRRRLREELVSADWLPAVCFDLLNEVEYPHFLILDSGAFCTVGEHLWEAGAQRFFMGSSHSRTMGASVPCAIGISIGGPGLPVFCVMGDGGIAMYPAEVKLAVEERLPVCFILMTDGRYGSVASVPQAKPMSQRAVTVPRPSWLRSMLAMGCDGSATASKEAFAKALESWDRKGPLFIEAAFEPESYAAMTRRLR